MNVAILHCHYRRGGVTQVVENHVAGLAPNLEGKVVLASGGRNDGLAAETIALTEQLVVKGLDYDAIADPSGRIPDRENLQTKSRTIATEIRDGLQRLGLSPDDTVLHWHNHSLGKNLAAPLVIKYLAEQTGYRQLLQIHDFAEDFRPENYLRIVGAAHALNAAPDFSKDDINTYSYPLADGIEYATLTSGDACVLDRLGVGERRVHTLPNSVTLGGNPLPDADESIGKLRRSARLPDDAKWCVYPVRGIRRKNVGEFLLVSRLLPENCYAGITLPPTTDVELQSYRRWQRIAADVAPRSVFDAGTFADVSFQENLAASSFIVSTSVAEGFGMAFLEPWLARRGVIARRLEGVTDDFSDAGVQLDRFYDSIEIPGDPTWLHECLEESEQAFRNAWKDLPEHYGHAFRIEQTQRETRRDSIDFATLTVKRQIEVLHRLSQDDGFQSAVRELNLPLVECLHKPFTDATLNHNTAVIASGYSIAGSADRLRSIYHDLLGDSTTTGHMGLKKGASVVDMICGERTYFPCRTELEIFE